MSAPLQSSAAAAETSPKVVTQAELDAALLRHDAEVSAARSRVRGLLERDDVRAMAEQHGVDLKRAEAAVSTLSDDEVQSLAAQAAAIETGLAGGELTIQISLVAMLLIVILILVLTR
jgi:hypothetical protein